MNRIEVILYYVSLVFQTAAMVFAVRMMTSKKDRRPWIMLFIAMAVMFSFRLIAIARGGGPASATTQFFGAMSSVLISMLLFGSLFFVRQLAVAEELSEATAKRRGVERDDARARLHAAMQAGDVATWVWHINEDRVVGDEHLPALFGIDSQENKSERYLDPIHPSDRPRVIAAIRSAMDGERSSFESECRLPRRDQSWRWVAVRGRIDRDEAGKPSQMVGLVLDISARKLAELAVQEAKDELELRLRHLADALPQLVWISRPDGVHEYYNQRWYDYLGVDPAQGAIDPSESLYPDDRDLSDSRWEHALISGEPYEMEYRFRRHDGVYRWFLGRALPLRDREGSIVKWFGTCTDIHEQKRTEEIREQMLVAERSSREEAERANRIKDEFLATLSHELRTPLNAIVGWSQLLKRSSDEESVREGVNVIERNARIQTQLIDDLLDMSRIVSGKIRLDVQTIDPTGFIEAAIETVTPAAEAREIRLHKTLDPRGPIAGDAARLQQVLWNLLSNAIKFTPKGGRVQVVLQRVNSHVEISVNDSGNGIDPEFLPHVFDRFRQADGSSTRRHSGLGLGLAIAKQLVELHGGTMYAQSDGLGKGATFSIHLPLTVVHPSDANRQHPGVSRDGREVPAQHRLEGLKVLVVDDEPDARDLVRRLLEDSGAEVSSAASGSEAIELVERAKPDVLVSDIGMPEMDGYELLRRVRALSSQKLNRIPAVALTAFARSEDRTKALLAGFLVHVSKPVQPSELIATVASVAGRTGESNGSDHT